MERTLRREKKGISSLFSPVFATFEKRWSDGSDQKQRTITTPHGADKQFLCLAFPETCQRESSIPTAQRTGGP